MSEENIVLDDNTVETTNNTTIDTTEEVKKNREAIMGAFKAQWLKRYGLDDIDLVAELQLIQQKKSQLSRSKRDAVVAYFTIFPNIPTDATMGEDEK